MSSCSFCAGLKRYHVMLGIWIQWQGLSKWARISFCRFGTVICIICRGDGCVIRALRAWGMFQRPRAPKSETELADRRSVFSLVLFKNWFDHLGSVWSSKFSFLPLNGILGLLVNSRQFQLSTLLWTSLNILLMIFKNPSCLPVSIHEQVYFSANSYKHCQVAERGGWCQRCQSTIRIGGATERSKRQKCNETLLFDIDQTRLKTELLSCNSVGFPWGDDQLGAPSTVCGFHAT